MKNVQINQDLMEIYKEKTTLNPISNFRVKIRRWIGKKVGNRDYTRKTDMLEYQLLSKQYLEDNVSAWKEYIKLEHDGFSFSDFYQSQLKQDMEDLKEKHR